MVYTSNDTMLARHGYGIINPKATSDSEYKSYMRAIAALKENPVKYSEFHTLFERQVGYSFKVPLQTLLMSWEHEEFSQYSVKPGNVLKLLMSPADGLLTGNKLSRHIEASYQEHNIREDGTIIDLFEVIIGGGRHRLGAIIFIMVISQMVLRDFDPLVMVANVEEFASLAAEIMEDDEFLELQVPVQPVLYSLQYIARSNQSRRMDASENNFINLQVSGIGVNIVDIAKAVTSKQLTPAKGWASMFALLADRDSLDITVLAANQLGSKVATYLKKNKFTFPTNSDNLVKLVQALWERMPMELKALADKKVTNIARDGVPVLTVNLAGYALTNARSLWDADSEVPADVKPAKTKKTADKKAAGTKKGKGGGSKLLEAIDTPVAVLDDSDAELVTAG